MPEWVLKEAVLAIHNRQIAEHGGAVGLRDAGLLESALEKPKNLYHYGKPTIAEMAASYAFGITRNHPFIDGNKRTAFVICRLFLQLNGQDLQASSQEKYRTFLQLGAGEISEIELSNWIATYLTHL